MSQSPPGQVDAADRSGEEQVAAEQMAVGVERDVRGRVAGNRDAFEGEPGDVDRLAALEQVIRRVWAARHAGRCELGVALEAVALTFGHVDRRTGALGEIGDAAEMVEVPVRDQDRGAARAEPRELETQLGRLAAWIDDDCGRRAAVRAHDVTVRLQRSQRKAIDDDVHAGECNGASGGQGSSRAALEPERDRDARRLALTGRAPLAGRREPRRADRARRPDRS